MMIIAVATQALRLDLLVSSYAYNNNFCYSRKSYLWVLHSSNKLPVTLDLVMVVIFAQPLDLRFSNSCGSGSHHASSLLLLQYLIVVRLLHSRAYYLENETII
jgi:hypothetical protein